MSKLTTITRELFTRLLDTKRNTALTGGTKSVDSIVITAGGTGYTSTPTVVFSAGAAAGTAILSGGIVVAVTITTRGSYTTPPTVSFTGGGGSGATGTVVMSPTSLDAVITIDKTVGEYLLQIAVGNDAYLYRLRAGTDAESSPTIIRPDDYATTTNEKVWELTSVATLIASALALKAGTSSGNIVKVGGVIFDFFTDANNSSTTETTLYSFTFPANGFSANGQKIDAKYGGIFAATINNKQLRVKFAGTTIFDSGVLAITAATSWEIEVLIVRTGSTTARASCKLNSSSATLAGFAQQTDLTGLTLTGTNALDLTGQGGASSDITAKLGFGQWLPAA